MELSPRKIVFALGVASLLVVCTSADNIVFGYMGPNGPDKWGSLKPEWKICNSGTQQSPIDIVKDDAKDDPTLQTDERLFRCESFNNGFNVRGVGNVLVEGKSCSLQQLHWHSPSEHIYT